MAQESHFRAALFGGFQKADVLAYIEALQNQILAMQGEQQQRSREVPVMRAQIQALTEELEHARVRETSFFDNAEEQQRQILVLERERDDLRVRLNLVSSGQERVRDVEGQVGKLILDALLYSEKIIARAKETAQIIARRAQDSMRGSVADVEGLGDDMTRISQDFSDSVTQLVGRMKGVSVDLSGMADSLEPDLRDGSEQYEFNAEGIPVLREQAEEEDDKEQPAEAESGQEPPAEDGAVPEPAPAEPDHPEPVQTEPGEDDAGPAEPLLEFDNFTDILTRLRTEDAHEKPAEAPPEPFEGITPPNSIPGGWFADAPLLDNNMRQIPPPIALPPENDGGESNNDA